ncbi:MAG: hypothetical protein E7397_02550 [Ruminococcaceae bacterium]|nr:hypothetical protein [Oscillospiraceae bacterium]
MKKRQKFVSLLLGCSMIASLACTPVMAEGNPLYMTQDFSTDIAMNQWTINDWSSVGGDVIFADASTAGKPGAVEGDGDKVLMLRRNGYYNTVNWNFSEMAKVQGMSADLADGETVEVSFDFAVERQIETIQDKGSSMIGLNLPCVGTDYSTSSPIYFSMLGTELKINGVMSTDEVHEPIYDLVNKDGSTWHRISLVARYEGAEEQEDGTSIGVGTSQLFVDGKTICEPLSFTYTPGGTYIMHGGNNVHEYSQDYANILSLRNESSANYPDILYFDDMVARQVDYTAFKAALAAAKTATTSLPEDYSQNALDALKDAIASYDDYEADVPASQEVLDAAIADLNALVTKLQNSSAEDDVVIMTKISEDFNGTLNHGCWGSFDWTYTPSADTPEFLPETSFAGRNAGEDDLALVWDNEGPQTNYIIWDLLRSGMTPVPKGEIFEFAFDMAVEPVQDDTATADTGLRVSINENDFSIFSGHRRGTIWNYATNTEQNQINRVINPNEAVTWHRYNMLVQYLDNGVGKAQIYMDGEAMGPAIGFTYEDGQEIISGAPYKEPFTAGQPSYIKIINDTWISTSDNGWFDNVVAGGIDFYELNQAYKNANKAIAELTEGGYSTMAKAALDKLLADNLAYKNKTADTLLPQAKIDEIAEAIKEATEELKNSTADDDAKYVPTVTYNFDGEWNPERWNPGALWQCDANYGQLVNSNGLFGRVATATDKALQWRNENPWANHATFKMMNNGMIDYYPRGMVMEASFDLAIEYGADDPTKVGGNSFIAINPIPGCEPIRIWIPHRTGQISSVQHSVNGTEVNEVLWTTMDPNLETAWHKISLLVRYDDDTLKTGTAAAYLDGKPLGSTYQFNYNAEEYNAAEYGVWKMNTPSVLQICNLTHIENSDKIYMDNLKLAPVTQKKAKLEKLVEDAYELYYELEETNGATAEQLEDFRLKIGAARSVYEGKNTTFEGIGDESEVLFTQELIDKAISELETLMNSFGLTVSVSEYGVLTATMVGKTATVAVAAYDSSDRIVAVISGDQTASLDMSTVDAAYAKAFAWDALGTMMPVSDAVPFNP